jgi:membrane protease YdiL (CAAX protease family)
MTALNTAGNSGDLQAAARQMYFQSDQAHEIANHLAERKAARAERPLRWIAILNTLGTLLVVAAAHRSGMQDTAMAQRLVEVHVAMCVAYWAVWAWSFAAPLPASIVGLLLLTSMSWANIAIHTDNNGTHSAPGAGPSIPFFTMLLLIRAIYNGWRQRVLVLDRELSPEMPKPRSRSILSAILLYLALLTIVITPLSLAVHQDLTAKDLLDVHKLMAIVVATWAIVCWRDTLPALRTAGSLNWLVTGVVFGLGTFVFASIYGDLSAYFSGIPQNKASAFFLDQGYSWWMILAVTAAFPAIFEELAFRGVIVPGLGRVLGEKETIAVSAIMFTILHLSVPSAPHLLLLGCLAGFVRLRSRSIWPCVLMHFTHNAMCIGFEKWM